MLCYKYKYMYSVYVYYRGTYQWYHMVPYGTYL